MPVSATLHEFLVHLHNERVINLDTPLRALVTVLPELASNESPTARRGDMFCGSWYVYVVGGEDAPRLGQVASVAAGVRAVTGEQRPSAASTTSSIPPDQSFILDKSGLIDLDRPLRSLVQAEGFGGLRVSGQRDSLFVTHRYVLYHESVRAQISEVSEAPEVADAVRKVTGSERAEPVEGRY